MARAARLLDLLQALRRRRKPVSGAALAQELGVSLRTLYRDVATLQAQGAPIEGEAGLGYVLRPGFTLPPLMFTRGELEALALGASWVASRADEALAEAADNALAKIADALPPDLADALAGGPLLVGPGEAAAAGPFAESVLAAIRGERRLAIRYRDRAGKESRRTIWPIALSYFDSARVIVAWCETRSDFRHFRLDRMLAAEMLADRYPRRRVILLADWRVAEGFDD